MRLKKEVQLLAEELGKVKERIDGVFFDVFTPNYFKDCPCCEGGEFVAKETAVEFVDRYGCTVCTTNEQYEIHKDKIKEWEEEHR